MPDGSNTNTAPGLGLGGVLNIAGGILGGAESLYQLADGAINLKKDKEELDRVGDVFYNIQKEFRENNNLANAAAQGGLTPGAKDYATTQIERGFGAGMQGVLNGGGSPNDIAKLFDVYGQSIGRVGAEDAEKQLDNIKFFTETNKELAGEKIKQWVINEYQPHEEKIKNLTQRIAADKQNMFGGASSLAGVVSATGTALSNADLMKKLFKGMGMNDSPGRMTESAKWGRELPGELEGQDVAKRLSEYTLQDKKLFGEKDFVETKEYNDWFGSLPPEEQSQLINNYYGK